MTTRRATTKKLPQRQDNNPIDFDLDGVKPNVPLKPFRFRWGGKRWTFLHIQELDCWGLLDGAREGEVGATLAAFRQALNSEEKYQELRELRLPSFKMNALFKAWQRHCGLDENGQPLAEAADAEPDEEHALD
jgi:hypothetical protein